MKIAVLTSGILPIPAVLGGAVENLIDIYLKYNDKYHLHDITVYSVYHPDIHKHPALQSQVNHYHFVDVSSLWAKIKRRLYKYRRKAEPYNHFIGYYFDQSLRHLLKHNYDLIILENRPSYALKLINRTNAKLIYHLHNEKLTKSTPDYQKIYDAAYKIINVSNYITSCVKTINPKDTKCVTVLNGINLEAFLPKRIVHINREDIGFDKNDFIIVFNGRINKEKGISELVDALLQLEDYPLIKLMVIGSSFFANENTEDDFIMTLKTKSQTISERIHFTGFIPYEKIPSYLFIADIAVLPSIWEEPFGLTIVEAMAAGLPLITTRSGGIPEVCENSAIIIERSNIVSNLKNAILHLYNNIDVRKELSASSLSRSRLFSKEKFAESFLAALEETRQNADS